MSPATSCTRVVLRTPPAPPDRGLEFPNSGCPLGGYNGCVDGRLEGEAIYHLANNDKYRRARELVAETARRSQRVSEAGKASANKRKNL